MSNDLLKEMYETLSSVIVSQHLLQRLLCFYFWECAPMVPNRQTARTCETQLLNSIGNQWGFFFFFFFRAVSTILSFSFLHLKANFLKMSLPHQNPIVS